MRKPRMLGQIRSFPRSYGGVVFVLVVAVGALVNCSGSNSSDVRSSGGSAGLGGRAGSAGAPMSTAGSSGVPTGGGGQAGAAGVNAAGTSPGKLERAEEVFSEHSVLEYRLTLAQSDRLFLDEHGDQETYVSADLSVSGGSFGTLDLGRIGIRHKGDTTLTSCWTNGVRSYANQCSRLSYKLSFNEYEAGTRLFGLKHLHLNVSYGDPSRLRELLAHRLFADFGVVAPRAAPAVLYLNEEFIGLFIAVEDVDGRFTAMHFPNGRDGNLYKEAWPRAGQPDSYYLDALRTNDGVGASVADMQQLAAAVSTLGSGNFETVMSRWIDVESLLRYLAVDRAIKNWDGVTAFYNPEGPHNFFFYHDDGTEDRFHLIPWDFNGAGLNAGVFVTSDPYMDEHSGQNTIPNINVAPRSCAAISIWNSAGDPGMTAPGCDPLLRYLMQTQWDRWVALGHELLEGPMSADRIQVRIDALKALIAPVVARDPLIPEGTWTSAVQALPSTISENRRAFERLLAEGFRSE